MAIELTHEFVCSFLRYEDGYLYWKKQSGPAYAGKQLTRINADGYICLSLKGRMLLAHRVIWFIHYGEWPNGQIDHINRNRKNNKLENLRVATNSTNQANRKPSLNRKFKGLCLMNNGKHRAMCAGKYLGVFNTPEEAAIAYNNYAKRTYGGFALLNKVEGSA